MKKAEKYDVDVIRVDNLNRVVGMECQPALAKTKIGIVGVGTLGSAHEALWLIFVDHGLDDADKAALSGFVMNDTPLVVGPRAAGQFTWQLKAEANSRGRIFEVAETTAAVEKLFASSLVALRRRFVRNQPRALPAAPSGDADPLAPLPGILAATHSLRSERGRLDAEKIRELFTLSRVDLARITGIQEETIRQTPDSERLQPPLRALERVARLLVLIPDRTKFAAWLHTANEELDQKTPLELIKENRGEVIATLVEDILLNRGR